MRKHIKLFEELTTFKVGDNIEYDDDKYGLLYGTIAQIENSLARINNIKVAKTGKPFIASDLPVKIDWLRLRK